MIDISVILFENDKVTKIIKVILGKGDKYEIVIGFFQKCSVICHKTINELYNESFTFQNLIIANPFLILNLLNMSIHNWCCISICSLCLSRNSHI